MPDNETALLKNVIVIDNFQPGSVIDHTTENPCVGGSILSPARNQKLQTFARILLGNGVRKCRIYSILCTTHEAELRFRFSYLQLLGLNSKSPELAFNQWVVGSSPTRLIQ